MPNPVLLILTVGTGTAGPESFIAEGLRKTVELIDPRRYWLVPSSAPASKEVADYVREAFPKTFAPWSESQHYALIERPDSLAECRLTIREVIAAARTVLSSGERLVVNPTSGTKQMSAGATVAALDERVGELAFTIGDRIDGVVRTGTERLETFDASGYFAEADYATAALFFAEGSFASAATILARHHKFRSAADLCRCLQEWERSNYSEALHLAKTSDHSSAASLIPSLETLVEEARWTSPSAAVVTDLLRSARHLQTIKEFENSLLRTCKALEIGLRLDLYERCGISEPYQLRDIESLNSLPQRLTKKMQAGTNKGLVPLGFRDLVELLQSQGSEVAQLYESSNIAKKAVRERNNLAHQFGSVNQSRAFMAIGAVTEVLTPLHLPLPSRFPKALKPS